MVFLAINNFFLCVFKNTNKKNSCVFIVSIAELKPKHNKKNVWGVFFGGPKWYFLKVKFQICMSTFVLYCKMKQLYANFHKKIIIFGPSGIFWKWKLWNACAGGHGTCTRQKFGFGLLKLYLTFGKCVFCRIKKIKKNHSTLLYNVHCTVHHLNYRIGWF